MASGTAPRPPFTATPTIADPLTCSMQPVIPIALRSNGSGTGLHAVRELPTSSSAAVVGGAEVSSSVTVSPSQGSAPPARSSDGVPALPGSRCVARAFRTFRGNDACRRIAPLAVVSQ